MVIPYKNNKGLSEVISTILIVLISIVAVTILASVIIPYTRNNLSKSQGCFDTIDQISFISEKSCYNNALNGNPGNTIIRVKFNRINVSEIYISLEEGINIKSYTLKEGESYTNINNNEPIKLPSMNGGERTYTFNNINSTKAIVGPIIKGNRCDITDQIELNLC